MQILTESSGVGPGILHFRQAPLCVGWLKSKTRAGDRALPGHRGTDKAQGSQACTAVNPKNYRGEVSGAGGQRG